MLSLPMWQQRSVRKPIGCSPALSSDGKKGNAPLVTDAAFSCTTSKSSTTGQPLSPFLLHPFFFSSVGNATKPTTGKLSSGSTSYGSTSLSPPPQGFDPLGLNNETMMVYVAIVLIILAMVYAVRLVEFVIFRLYL